MKVAFYKSKKNLFNRLVAWWTKGPYSHCELVVRNEGVGDKYLCYSSSIGDGGVRAKVMALPADKWDIIEVNYDEKKAEDWFLKHIGAGYDYLGLLGFVIASGEESPKRYFCSEAVAWSLGIGDPHKKDPNTLYKDLKYNRVTLGLQ